jgi:hypothetical protein
MDIAGRARRTLSVVLLLCVGGPVHAQSPEPVLPPGIQPLTEPVTLQYRDVGRFSYTFRMDIALPKGRRSLAEGWVMDGNARPEGDGLAWSYRLSNIGRDGVAREAGSLVVTTDAWGLVRQARVEESSWLQPGRRLQSAADGYFSAEALRFPLCCCPRGPLRTGTTIEPPVGLESMPQTQRLPGDSDASIERHHAASVVLGILDQAGRRFLVVVHKGETVDRPGKEALVSRLSGYSLIDIRTCLPWRSEWLRTIEEPGRGAGDVFGLLHSNGTGR